MGRLAYPRTVFTPMAGGKWSATMETPGGLASAVGESIGDAQHALDELLVIARALEVSRRERTIAYPCDKIGRISPPSVRRPRR